MQKQAPTDSLRLHRLGAQNYPYHPVQKPPPNLMIALIHTIRTSHSPPAPRPFKQAKLPIYIFFLSLIPTYFYPPTCCAPIFSQTHNRRKSHDGMMSILYSNSLRPSSPFYSHKTIVCIKQEKVSLRSCNSGTSCQIVRKTQNKLLWHNMCFRRIKASCIATL